MNGEVTIIIQGPLHNNGIEIATDYLKHGPVIFSCWESCDISKISHKFPIIINKIPKNDFFNRMNVFFQSLTSYSGIKKVETDLVIKVRCDESYSDLSYFIDTMRSNPDCMTTNNVFFRSDNFMKFHPSDHVIGGRTDYLMNTFGTLVEECQTKASEFRTSAKLGNSLARHEKWRRPDLCFAPEVLIATRFLRAKGVPIIPRESIRIMKENFRLVSVSKMGQFIVSTNSINSKVTTEKDMEKLGMLSAPLLDRFNGIKMF